MQARLAMASVDAVATSPQGAGTASGKKGVEGAFAGMLLTSGKLVAPVEHPAVPSGGPAEGSGKAAENDEGDRPDTVAADVATALPAGLVPWKALVVNPQTDTPAETGEADQAPGQVSDNAADPPPPAKVSALHAMGAGAGFAHVGGVTVVAATTMPAPPAPLQETLTPPVAEDPVDAMATVTDPKAAGAATPSDLPAGQEELPAQKAALAPARPLEVADILALKARQLRQQETGGETGKATYEDPRLARDHARQDAVKPMRLKAADVVKVAPSVADRAETSNSAQEAVTVSRDIPAVTATLKTVKAKGAPIPQVPVAPVKEGGAESPVQVDPKAGAAQDTKDTSAAKGARKRHESPQSTPASVKATPAASPQAEGVKRQAATLHGEQSAPESHVGEKAGPDTTTGTNRISSIQDRSAARTATPVFRQVVENLDLQNTGSKVRIQLNPAHLGRLEVSLTARNHTLEVRIVADSPQATQALEGNIHDLTEGLKAKAGHFQHLDVHVEARDTVRFKPEDGQPDRRDQQRGQERQGGGRQNGSRDRRQDRPGSGRQSRAWYWSGTKEDR